MGAALLESWQSAQGEDLLRTYLSGFQPEGGS
jgi:hypothetical protein